MTDNSKFVLRWEIADVTAKIATGRVETEVIEKGGFRWTSSIEQRAIDGFAAMSLHCHANHDRPWKCEVVTHAVMFTSLSRRSRNVVKDQFCFSKSNNRWLHNKVIWKDLEPGPNEFNDNNIFLEYLIEIISSERAEITADTSKFAVPNRRSDVILKIGDEKLYVSKEYLAIHSPVFESLFFGKFVENGKEEVEIKDVDYEEFLDLLNLIYPDSIEITDRSVEHILKLADRFQMEEVITRASKYLSKSAGFDEMAKLLLADKYRLAALKEHCLNSFTSATEMSKMLKSSLHFDQLSEAMKASICEKIVQLTE